MVSPLDQLPVKTLKAKMVGGEEVDVLVDGDYDGEYFEGFNLRVLPSGYVLAQGWRIKTTRFIYLHQLVLPPKKGYWTHFKNGNKLDCRSANLEYITPSMSAATRKQRDFSTKTPSPAFSKYRGVTHLSHKEKGKPMWVSPKTFSASCATKYLGTFNSEIKAALAYDEAAKERWGEAAILNFPDGAPEIPEPKEVEKLVKAQEDGRYGFTDKTRKYNNGQPRRKQPDQIKKVKYKCRWCGKKITPPAVFHDKCLEAKRRVSAEVR